MEKNYYDNRTIESINKTRSILKHLPPFAEQYFISIESKTSPLTQLNYAIDLQLFFHFLHNNTRICPNIDEFTINDLSKITSFDIEKFISWLSKYELNGKIHSNGNKSKARKLSSIRSFFAYYFKKNMLPSNESLKIDMPKINSKDIVRLEPNEMIDFLDEAEYKKTFTDKQIAYNRKTLKRDTALLYLFLGTGIRVSECVGLDIIDFDFENNAFRVTRKGGNQAILYFTDEVKEKLIDYYEERINREDLDPEEKAFFISTQKKRITVRAVENLVKKYAEHSVPLKNISPHKLRSTFGTNLYRETQDIYLVANLLGHKDVNTTKKHYAAINEEQRKNATKVIKIRKD